LRFKAALSALCILVLTQIKQLRAVIAQGLRAAFASRAFAGGAMCSATAPVAGVASAGAAWQRALARQAGCAAGCASASASTRQARAGQCRAAVPLPPCGAQQHILCIMRSASASQQKLGCAALAADACMLLMDRLVFARQARYVFLLALHFLSSSCGF
jgi:hypothetical protein